MSEGPADDPRTPDRPEAGPLRTSCGTLEFVDSPTLGPRHEPAFPPQGGPAGAGWSPACHRSFRGYRAQTAASSPPAPPAAPPRLTSAPRPAEDSEMDQVCFTPGLPGAASSRQTRPAPVRPAPPPLQTVPGASFCSQAEVLSTTAGAPASSFADPGAPAGSRSSDAELYMALADGCFALSNLLINKLIEAAAALRPHLVYWRWASEQPQWFPSLQSAATVHSAAAARFARLRQLEWAAHAAIGRVHLRLDTELSQAIRRMGKQGAAGCTERSAGAAERLGNELSVLCRHITWLGGHRTITVEKRGRGGIGLDFSDQQSGACCGGVRVHRVTPGSAAHWAGLCPGMVLLEIDCTVVTSKDDAEAALAAVRARSFEVRVLGWLPSLALVPLGEGYSEHYDWQRVGAGADNTPPLPPVLFSDGPEGGPEDRSPTVLAQQMLDCLEAVMALPEELVSALGDLQCPGHMRRQWVPYTALAVAAFSFAFWNFRGNHSLLLLPSLSTVWEWAGGVASGLSAEGPPKLGRAVQHFWVSAREGAAAAFDSHLLGPLSAIVTEFLYPYDTARDEEACQESRAALSSMLIDFLRTACPGDEGAVRSALADPLDPECWQPVMRVYDEQVKRPVWSMVTGDVVRALLLQLHRTKHVIDMQMTQMHTLLNANQFNMNCMAVVPFLMLIYGVNRVVFQLLHYISGPSVGIWPMMPSRNLGTRDLTAKETLASALRELHRALSAASCGEEGELPAQVSPPLDATRRNSVLRGPSAGCGADAASGEQWHAHGYMLGQVSRLEAAACRMPLTADDQDSLAGDLLVLKDSSCSALLRLRAVQRIAQFMPSLRLSSSA